MSYERRTTRVCLGPRRCVPDPERRRTLVLTTAAFAVPIVAMLAFAAVQDSAALSVVIVGVGVVAVLTPWATSGLQSGRGESDRGHGEERGVRGPALPRNEETPDKP